jgi:hypothetical protein
MSKVPEGFNSGATTCPNCMSDLNINGNPAVYSEAGYIEKKLKFRKENDIQTATCPTCGSRLEIKLILIPAHKARVLKVRNLHEH